MLTDQEIKEKLIDGGIEILEYGVPFVAKALKNGFSMDVLIDDLQSLQNAVQLHHHPIDVLNDANLEMKNKDQKENISGLSDGRVRGCGEDFYDPETHDQLNEFQGIGRNASRSNSNTVESKGNEFLESIGKKKR